MGKCSTRNHENAKQQVLRFAQDDNNRGQVTVSFRSRSFEYVDRLAINFTQDDSPLGLGSKKARLAPGLSLITDH